MKNLQARRNTCVNASFIYHKVRTVHTDCSQSKQAPLQKEASDLPSDHGKDNGNIQMRAIDA
jgi:hypothetical protein